MRSRPPTPRECSATSWRSRSSSATPSGMQPRAAVIYMTIAALECAALYDAAPALHTEIDAAGPQLTELAAEWGPDSPPDSEAKRLARTLQGSVPVVHGAGPTVAVARR